MQLRKAFLFGATLLLSAVVSKAASYEVSPIIPPKPSREFRGVWIATVANIDWPSARGLSTAQQKAELISTLDQAVQLKLNVVVLQVRPACDALYASAIEPWSEYLTGTMGKAPEPFYDPLAFAISEAHKRGLELHAWFNPFRALHKSHEGPISLKHISRRHPDFVHKYGEYLWLDPGEPGVREYSLSVIMDVVRRYDIDGVHLDDYFYPYAETNRSGNAVEFPDDATWQKYGSRTKLGRDDWRRENVNEFVSRVYKSIKQTKPWVKFGISPFGIWRPRNPPEVPTGYDAYARLYADSRKWLVEGWVDYLAPQLYWPIDSRTQSFPALLNWWDRQNPKHHNLIVGIAASNAGKWRPEEIPDQIRLARQHPGASGYILYSMKSLLNNAALSDSLSRQVNNQPALPSDSPWLESPRATRPVLEAGKSESPNMVRVTWRSGTKDLPRLWVLQTRSNNLWSTQILPGFESSDGIAGLPDVIAISEVDRFGNLSVPAVVSLIRERPVYEAPRPKPKRPLKRLSTPKNS